MKLEIMNVQRQPLGLMLGTWHVCIGNTLWRKFVLFLLDPKDKGSSCQTWGTYLKDSYLSSRYKGRRLESHAPHVPNQPSEAAAHFYFELAKTVLIKAGGNSSTSIFTHPSSSGGHQGPHRNLHLCAFEIGLYALGLHNFVSPNWLSRTYSSHVSWITGYSKTLLGSLLLGRKWGREASLFLKMVMLMCCRSHVSSSHSCSSC